MKKRYKSLSEIRPSDVARSSKRGRLCAVAHGRSTLSGDGSDASLFCQPSLHPWSLVTSVGHIVRRASATALTGYRGFAVCGPASQAHGVARGRLSGLALGTYTLSP